MINVKFTNFTIYGKETGKTKDTIHYQAWVSTWIGKKRQESATVNLSVPFTAVAYNENEVKELIQNDLTSRFATLPPTATPKEGYLFLKSIT